MIFCTSLSPSHKNKDVQQTAVDSWSKFGKVYSFNSAEEIIKLKYKGVKFIETERTMQHTFKKPYVSVSAIIDWAKKKNDDICIINSDIELICSDSLMEKIKKALKTSLVLANRNDYDTDKKKSETYLRGLDVFFLSKKHLDIYPQSTLCLGQCHFDYWIPYKAIFAKVPVIILQNKIALHKKHSVQYSYANWLQTAKTFAAENKFSHTDMPRMTELLFKFIYLFMQSKKL